ncbi:MAG: SAVED domain-containing protein [Methylococcales bacterium]
MNNQNLNLLNQALHAPIEDLVLIETQMKLVSSQSIWSDVGVFIDEAEKAVLILMLENNHLISMLRFCLSINDSVKAIELLCGKDGRILFGTYQGGEFSYEDLTSLESINAIWNKIPDQIVVLNKSDVTELFQRLDDDSKKKGRGDSFSTDTKRKVMLDSHGRCMFEGCGQDLGIDSLTNTKGNYSYLAHNIASSEQGARGVKLLSEKLSNDPNNILLLCDKHHRLIDKVAAADYSAHRLSDMRRQFSATVNNLLDGLGYQPVPAYSVLWPVHRQVISAPSYIQISQSLSPLHCRLLAQLNDLSDNESILRETDPSVSNAVLIQGIKTIADRLLSQTHNHRYKAGLFAFGLMPHLIALGALIGNKNSITPMLRFRDSGQWVWPAESPRGKFYTITGLDELTENEENITISLVLTAEPDSLVKARNEISNTYKAKHIIIKALPEYLGNGALGHPDDGYLFTNEIQSIFHALNDRHGVKKIHLFPCASNAACVFFGEAFDSHHPDLLIYDFENQTMKPVILARNINNRCEIFLP